MNQSCRTCKFLDVRPDKAGRLIARKGFTYRCVCVPPEPAVPDSWKQAGVHWAWPPWASRMEPDDGENCQTYQPRDKK